MKRRLSAFVLALLLLTVSCSETQPETPPAQDPGLPVEDIPGSEPVEAETRPPHNLPEMDFDGAEFRISCYGDGAVARTLQPEELTGEAVNDAIFNRNTMLTEQYNFTFNTIPYGTDYGKHTHDISTMVRAGDDAYEMIYGHVVGTCNNAINGDAMYHYCQKETHRIEAGFL